MSAPIRPTAIINTLKQHYKLLVVPTVAAATLAAIFSMTSPDLWEASQGFWLRDEVTGDLGPLGRFNDRESLKAAQETVTEVAHNESVVAATLRAVGPAKPGDSENWPDAEAVRELQGRISLNAARGAAFGESEVVYLNVLGESPERARRLVETLSKQLRKRLQELRNQRADDIVLELNKSVELSENDLNQALEKVSKIEQEVGEDLGELRQLIAEGGGDGNLRTRQVQLDAEIRQAKRELLEHQEQLRYLETALETPGDKIVIPSKLFQSHSTLQRLNDGLADAQLKTARLLGIMTSDHPKVIDAMEEERRARATLQQEIILAMASLKAEIQGTATLLNAMETQKSDVNQRLTKLAEIHTQYRAAVDEVKQRTSILENGRRDLNEARASQAAALSSSLLSPIDQPVIGEYPVGLGTKVIVALGAAGGLSLGLALVFLVAPVSQRFGRRWSDFVGGRRASDQERSPGRRSEDSSTSVPRDGRRATDRAPEPATEPVAEPATATVAERVDELATELVAEPAAELVLGQPAETVPVAATSVVSTTPTQTPPAPKPAPPQRPLTLEQTLRRLQETSSH